MLRVDRERKHRADVNIRLVGELDALSKFHITDERQPMTDGNLYEPPAMPAHTHGERPPRVGLARFALWAAGRSLRIEVDSAIHRMRRWRQPRQRTLEAA